MTQVPAFIVCGIGMSLFFAPVANVVLGSVRRDQEGIASGANNAIRELGGVFGIAVLGAVFSARGGYSSGAAFVSGLAPAVWVGSAAVAAAVAAALLLPRSRKAATAAPADEPAEELDLVADPQAGARICALVADPGSWRAGRGAAPRTAGTRP